MVIPFQTLKVIQACAVLLRAHEGQMSRLRLLKLLYIADRECLAESLRPITGDRPVAMNPGVEKLSQYEIDKLQSVSERHRSMNDYDIALETHEFAEWQRNQPDRPRSSKPIPLEDLFSALGLADHAAELEASAAKEAELDELLGGAVTG